MTSPLSTVPIASRRRAAWAAGSLAGVMVVIFVLAWTRPAPSVVRLFATVALAGAILLGLMTWGVVRSIRLDQAHARVDAAIAAHGGASCDCGHSHDPDETHVAGACDQSCAECLHAQAPAQARDSASNP